VFADACPAAVFTVGATALVLAEGCPSAFSTKVSLPIVLANAPPVAVCTVAPLALVLANASPAAVFTAASDALVLANAPAPPRIISSNSYPPHAETCQGCEHAPGEGILSPQALLDASSDWGAL